MSRLISCLDTAMLKLSKLHMNKHYMSHCMLYLPELYDNHDRLIVSKTRFHKLWANWQGYRFYGFFIYSKLIELPIFPEQMCPQLSCNGVHVVIFSCQCLFLLINMCCLSVLLLPFVRLSILFLHIGIFYFFYIRCRLSRFIVTFFLSSIENFPSRYNLMNS